MVLQVSVYCIVYARDGAGHQSAMSARSTQMQVEGRHLARDCSSLGIDFLHSKFIKTAFLLHVNKSDDAGRCMSHEYRVCRSNRCRRVLAWSTYMCTNITVFGDGGLASRGV